MDNEGCWGDRRVGERAGRKVKQARVFETLSNRQGEIIKTPRRADYNSLQNSF